jgi:hypothetical protein
MKTLVTIPNNHQSLTVHNVRAYEYARASKATNTIRAYQAA